MSTEQSKKFHHRPGFSLLVLLTFINLFNYLDRYILVALSPQIKRELLLSDTQVGFLATAFMFSYFLVSPLFGWLGDRQKRMPLLSFGVGLWSLATIWCGQVKGFSGLIWARFAVGVGEASYGAISPSILTDLYPKSLRGKAFAVFFMAIPVGSALGYLLGGILEKAVGWRHAFLFAGLPGLILAATLWWALEPKRGTFDDEKVRVVPKVKEILLSLTKNRDYVTTTLGYCAYTFTLGGVAVWIPHYMERYLSVQAADGNMAFGALTVVAGFLGTFVGGAWADRWAAKSPDAYLKLSAISMLCALPVFWGVLQAQSFLVFCVWVFALEFLLFLSTSPVNAQIVNSVSVTIRASANAVSIFAIHLLGDAISPPLVGWVSDRTSLHIGMSIFLVAIALAALIWGLKPILFWEVLPWPKERSPLPLSQCHRGYHDRAQENTLAAFQAAASAGASMVELDVRLSKDGVAVVVHDEDLIRVSGRGIKVSEATANDLKVMGQVPTLADVLEDAKCKSLQVNIEIKSVTLVGNGLESAIAKVVQRSNAEERVIFSSFNPFALRRISKLLPTIPRALLVTLEKNELNKIYLRKMWLATFARPHMVNFDGLFLSDDLARMFMDRKIPFAVWTINSKPEAKKFLAMGAKSIISPLPNIV